MPRIFVSRLSPAAVGWASLCAVALFSSCAELPAPAVPVVASETGLEALAGEWWGEYSSAETGRSGRIRFRLEAGQTIAHGDVTMFSRRASELPSPANLNTGRGTSEVLSIRFLQLHAEDLTVIGNLEPYRDPECGCILSTAFVGRLEVDRITGTFMSHGGPLHPPTTGRWRVDRQRPDFSEAPDTN